MKLLFSFITILVVAFVNAQVGIGTTTPSNVAMLEINSGTAGNYRGLMPPRVPDVAAQLSINPTAADAGLMVFVESTGCLDLWNGMTWDNINCVGGTANLWINEFHYDNVGVNTGTFIEVAGVAGIDLADYYILRYNSTGFSYGRLIALVGVIDDESMGYGAVSIVVNNLQVGPNDGFALFGPNGLIQFLSYEGAITVLQVPINGVSEDVLVSESGTTPVGQSLQLIGTGNTYTDFTWAGPVAESPGTLNAGQIIN